MAETASQPECPVEAYARAVLAGQIVAGRLVRLACQRHLSDLETGRERGLHFDHAAANRAISFFRFLRLAEGDFAGKPFALQPFQQFIIGCLFGWKDCDDKRRFRTAYIEIGKGNGKSPLAGAVGLLGLMADGEAAAEIYSAATTREQAGILFRDAKNMANASPDLTKRLDVGQANIAHPTSNSFFRPVSSEHRGLDGKRVHVALIDELHEHPTALVVDKMRAGTKGRRQAIVFEITNSGHDRTSVCWQHHEYSRQILEGSLQDDTWFAYVCGLDPCEEHLKEGKQQPVDGCKACDDWTDEACWPKANPGLGTILPIRYIREQVHEAKGMPTKEGIVRRLNLCQWCVIYGTMITMADGSRRRAESLKPGDVIMAFDEATGLLVRAKVERVADNGTQSVYRVTTARGRSVTTTGNHRFWIRYGRTDAPKYGWIEAADLKPGSRIAVALGNVIPQGSRRINAKTAYILGAMIGDGSCKGSPRLTSKTRPIVEKCNSILRQHGCEFATQPNGKYHHARHLVHSLKMTWVRKTLRDHGLKGKTAHDKRVPEAIFKGGANVWGSFLSGYLDTDGDIGKDFVRWTSVNRDLLSDCQHLLSLLGVQGSVRTVSRYDGTDQVTHRLEVRDKRSLSKLLPRLDLAHPKKIRRLAALDLINHRCGHGACPEDVVRFDRITTVEQLPPEPTIGIEIQGVHTHVTEGLITHNTEHVEQWLSTPLWIIGNQSVNADDLKGQSCWGGLDLSNRFDVTALVLVFKTLAAYKLLPFFWIPRECAREREAKDKVPWLLWERQGHVKFTDGDVTDYEFIQEFIEAELSALYQIEQLAYDPYNATQMAVNLQTAGLKVFQFNQNMRNFNEPTKEFEAALKEGRLHHGNHPVLTWMAGNVAVKRDAQGNVRPVKPEGASAKKVDGIVAAIMGLAGAMLSEGSDWYTPGVLTA